MTRTYVQRTVAVCGTWVANGYELPPDTRPAMNETCLRRERSPKFQSSFYLGNCGQHSRTDSEAAKAVPALAPASRSCTTH